MLGVSTRALRVGLAAVKLFGDALRLSVLNREPACTLYPLLCNNIGFLLVIRCPAPDLAAARPAHALPSPYAEHAGAVGAAATRYASPRISRGSPEAPLVSRRKVLPRNGIVLPVRQ